MTVGDPLTTALVDDLDAQVRDAIRREGVDPQLEVARVRHLAEHVVRIHDERSLTGAVRPVTDAREVVGELVARVAGFGPLQRFLDDPTVEEVWINHPSRVFVARNGRHELTNVILSRAQVQELVERMLKSSGRRIDLSQPFVDAMLPQGHRLHVVLEGISRDFAAVNIRKFVVRAARLDDLVGLGSLTTQAARFLEACVHAGLNIVVAGGTQAGKTTMLNCLAAAIPGADRIISCEEVFELRFSHPDWVAMQTRQAGLEGTGEVGLRDLVREALRMRPTRVVVGEVRSAECLDLLLALNSGLPGMATIHANSAREALVKLCTLPLLAGDITQKGGYSATLQSVTERGILYGRASRDPKGGGTSVTKQLDRGRDFANREEIDVVAEIRDDNRSASRGSRERPGFIQVRGMIERGGADLLILWEVSRSSRDLEEFMGLVNACSDHGLEIAVSGTRYDPSKVNDWLPLAFQGVMAEAEARRIKQRNIDSVETNAMRGTPHGRIPYGFRRVYDPKTGVLITQTPYDEHDPNVLSTEARVIADAVNALLKGVTLRQVCRDLNARGVPTPRKPRKKTLADNPRGIVTAWEPSTLRQMLLNPTIAGRRVHRGEDIGPAAWDPIVDYGTWLRLRNYLKDPSRLTVSNPRGPAPRHLLSGIAHCGECGARMKAATNMSRLPRAYTCRTEGCMRVTASADRVDERVEAVLFALFERSDFQRALADAHKRRETAAAKGPDVASRIAAKEAELDAVEKLRETRELTLRAYAAETKRIEEAINHLRSQQAANVSSPALRRLLTAATLQDGWEKADLMDRREAVRLLLDVTIKRATQRGRIFDPRRVEVRPSAFLTDGQASPAGDFAF